MGNLDREMGFGSNPDCLLDGLSDFIPLIPDM